MKGRVAVIKKLLVWVLISLFSCWTVYGYDLFVNSEPIHAEVYSGQQLIGKTPLRLSSLTSDRYELRVKKKGFEDVIDEVELGEGKERIRFYALSPLNISIVLNQKSKDVYLNEIKAGTTPLVIANMPSGTYSIESDKDTIAIENSEYLQATRTAVTETIFSGALFGGSIVGIALYSSRNDTMNAHAFGLTSVVFGALLGYNLLKLSKLSMGSRKDKASMSGVEIREYTGTDDRNTFMEGMEHIGKEQWDEALKKFILVVNLYEDSHFVPISYYEAGYCYFQMGNYPKALQYMRDFVYEYPIYELFPYGVNYLLDIRLRLGRPEDALEDYNRLRPVAIDDESGNLYGEYYENLVTLFRETGEEDRYILEDLLGELDRYLESFPDSASYPGILLMKGKLLYEWLDREKGLSVFEEIGSRFSYDKKITREMESIVNE